MVRRLFIGGPAHGTMREVHPQTDSIEVSNPRLGDPFDPNPTFTMHMVRYVATQVRQVRGQDPARRAWTSHPVFVAVGAELDVPLACAMVTEHGQWWSFEYIDEHGRPRGSR